MKGITQVICAILWQYGLVDAEERQSKPTVLVGHGSHLIGVDANNSIVLMDLGFVIDKMTYYVGNGSVFVVQNEQVHRVPLFRPNEKIEQNVLSTKEHFQALLFSADLLGSPCLTWIDNRKEIVQQFSLESGMRITLLENITTLIPPPIGLVSYPKRTTERVTYVSLKTVPDVHGAAASRAQFYVNELEEIVSAVYDGDRTIIDAHINDIDNGTTKTKRLYDGSAIAAISIYGSAFLTMEKTTKLIQKRFVSNFSIAQTVADLNVNIFDDQNETFLMSDVDLGDLSDYAHCPDDLCQHLCVRTITGPRCLCNSNYELEANERNCSAMVVTVRGSQTKNDEPNAGTVILIIFLVLVIVSLIFVGFMLYWKIVRPL